MRLLVYLHVVLWAQDAKIDMLDDDIRSAGGADVPVGPCRAGPAVPARPPPCRVAAVDENTEIRNKIVV